jgi:hypothetical protein
MDQWRGWRWLALAAVLFGPAVVGCDDDNNSTGQGGAGGNINVTTGRGGAGGIINVTTGLGGAGGLSVIGPGGAPPIAGSGGIVVGGQ